MSENINNQNLNTNKCYHCNKKLKTLFFTCKCKYTFCLNHQIPELHNCTFDFKKQFKEELKKNNPIIEPSKIKSF